MTAPHRFDLDLPRHAVSPRQVARAGDVWRLLQEAAVRASAAAGYPAQRYLDEEVAFVVVSMVVQHARELRFGQPVSAETWIRRNRRGMISDRELRLTSAGRPVASASQQWVHVTTAEDPPRPARASASVQAAFAPVAHADPGPIALPTLPECAPHSLDPLRFSVWHGWMDPLGHVNHPVYIDWCDEALRRALAAVHADPQRLVPVAEQVRFRTAAVGGDRVRVDSEVVGHARGTLAVTHRAWREPDGALLAEATTLRRLTDGGPSLPELLLG